MDSSDSDSGEQRPVDASLKVTRHARLKEADGQAPAPAFTITISIRGETIDPERRSVAQVLQRVAEELEEPAGQGADILCGNCDARLKNVTRRNPKTGRREVRVLPKCPRCGPDVDAVEASQRMKAFTDQPKPLPGAPRRGHLRVVK